MYSFINKLKTARRSLVFICIVICTYTSNAQSRKDSPAHSSGKIKPDSTVVKAENGDLFIYKRPRPFSFLTQVPRTLALSARTTFQKKSIPAISAMAGLTVILISVDQDIARGARQFGQYIHLDGERRYAPALGFKMGSKQVNIFETPQNLNSAMYTLGEGLTSIVLSGALFTFGKIKQDYRMVQTANQILQVQLAVGVTTQVMKRISGRESPSQASAPGGIWRPFPGFSEYLNKTSRYDAFPSGHLATMMATVTVLALNYPEKKWIRWVGGSLITLVGFAMINNEVHWAGDYPLALGIGYVTAQATVKMNRMIQFKK